VINVATTTTGDKTTMNAIHAHTVRAVLALAMCCFGNEYAQT
jgi:hypothetical protein